MLMIEKQNYLKASHKSDSLLTVDGAVRRTLFSVTRIKSSNQMKRSIQWQREKIWAKPVFKDDSMFM